MCLIDRDILIYIFYKYCQCVLQEALDSLNKALEIDEELDDRVGLALDYMNIGNVLGDKGMHQEGLGRLIK